MGATIHMHVETRRGDTWFHFAAPSILRDRTFFQLLADLDGDGVRKPVAPARGLPADLSEVTRFCRRQDGERVKCHHESYLTASELETLQERLWDIFGDRGALQHDLEGHYFNTYINGNTVAQHQGWDDVRLVYWFDN